MWIEMFAICKIKIAIGSRLARALWIEIADERPDVHRRDVEARESLVD